MARHPVATTVVTVAALLLIGCSADETPRAGQPDQPNHSVEPTATSSAPAPEAKDTDSPDLLSLPGVAAQDHRGDRLQVGAVREQTTSYTSYDVAWRLRSTGPGADGEPLRLTGVLNVPTGEGSFPAVVLAHGYVDPAVYRSGQGMTRERAFLAEQGYVALHVDYRGHAGSDPDPYGGTDARLGYAVDVLSAVDALRGIAVRDGTEVPVDPERIGVFGRSMVGGVVQKVAAIDPDAVGAVVAWASVSSLEAENFEHFIGADDPRAAPLAKLRGLPDDSPEWWRGVSSRPYLDRITAPVLTVHGRLDDTCPPRWARATQRAMQQAGVDSELVWYDDGHAFGPAFVAAMERTVDFLDVRLD